MEKGKVIRRKQPCHCGQSSDAADHFSTGWAHCHSSGCVKPNWRWSESAADEEQEEDLVMSTETRKTSISMEDVDGLNCRGNAARLISKEVAEFYGVKARTNLEGDIDRYFFPITGIGSNDITGYKTKNPNNKSDTWTIGKVTGLFGLDKFRSGGKRIIITEGEEDACAIQTTNFARWKKAYPVVSMGSGSQTDFLLQERETLTKFDEIILWFDNDGPGQLAVAEAAKILGFDRVKVIKSTEKDANDALRYFKDERGKFDLEAGVKRVQDYLFNTAQPYNPSGLLSGEALWAEVERYDSVESVPYPSSMHGLNSKLQGMRLGEIVLLTSGSGTGKSSIIREIIYNLLETTEDKIGVIALEESPGETTRKLSGIALSRNPAEEKIPLDELRVGFDKVFGGNRVTVLDHAGAATDNRVIDLIEFMCASGIKYIFIDHLTIMISEGVEGRSGLEAQDKVMNDLLRLVKRYNVCIGLVSHLRKTQGSTKSFEEGGMPSMDDIRGSGSTKQIAMDIIAFARNTVSDDEAEKNTINFRVLKCRHTGLTGSAGSMHYNRKTGRLVEGVGEDIELQLVDSSAIEIRS